MTAVKRTAAFAAALLLSSPGFALGAPTRDRAECVRVLDGATSGLARELRLFEANRPESAEALTAARRVIAAATEARDRLEVAKVSAFCAASRDEELIFLNHLVPGFRGWIDARSRRPPVKYDLASIVRWARIHQGRGRSRLQ